MKKIIACLLLVVLALPTVALADPSFDFVIANSIFKKYVYSSPVRNTDSCNFGGVTPNATNLLGTDSVDFSIVNTSNTEISNSVPVSGNDVDGNARTIYYKTAMVYHGIDVKLRGKFLPRNYEAYIRGTWAP